MGLPLFDRSTLPIGVAKDVEVVVIKAVADEDIDNQFQGLRLSYTGLSNKKDSVSRFLFVLDDPLFERRYIAKKICG